MDLRLVFGMFQGGLEVLYKFRVVDDFVVLGIQYLYWFDMFCFDCFGY